MNFGPKNWLKAAFCITVFTASCAEEENKFSVKAGAIVEKRVSKLTESALPLGYSLEVPSVSVVLWISGVELNHVRALEKISIVESIDDMGNSLNSTDGFLIGNQQRREFDRNLLNIWQEKGPNALPVEVYVKCPSRTATKLAVLKGEIQLGCWENLDSIKVAFSPSKAGDVLENTDLQKLGIQVKNIGFEGNDPKRLLVQFSGDLIASGSLFNLKVSDGETHEVISTGHNDVRSRDAAPTPNSVFEFGRPAPNIRILRFPLKDEAEKVSLSFVVASGRKFLYVPFELKDIKLP